MHAPSDEETGRPHDTAGEAAVDITLHPRGMDLGVELVGEPLDVQPELTRVLDQVLAPERPARLIHPVVHLPEGALSPRRLGRLGGTLGVGMNLAQRKVAEGEEQATGELIADAMNDRISRGAVRALEVAVHDELELGPVGPVDVVLG